MHGDHMKNESSKIFDNVTNKKNLPIYTPDGQTDPKKLANYLEFSNQDMAKAAGISEKSVRYDNKRMPDSLRIRVAEIANVCEMVAEHFDGDAERTALWFRFKNPILGGISPRDMIRFGRYQKLLQVIMDFKHGNIA